MTSLSVIFIYFCLFLSFNLRKKNKIKLLIRMMFVMLVLVENLMIVWVYSNFEYAMNLLRTEFAIF